ncbi:MAG: MFS transporter [Chloroflexi bacterium]|nr:MFS transporter [Chloroflexota bacterium]
MTDKGFKVYGYRWVVLGVFMFINLTIQMLWIAYAPITGPAAKFYGVTDLHIGLLAMTFMLAFIPLSIPVSWAIDTYGFRKTVSLGAIIMGVFGVARGLAGADYTLVLISTIGLAIAQPFLLNAWTKVPAQWFSIEERATAVGLVTLANLVGTALGMVLTPMLIETMSIPSVQLIYGGLAAVSAVLFVIFAREKPITPPCPPGQEVRALMLDGLKHALKVKDFLLYLAVSFIGLGLFNGINTWVENIIRPRGFTPTDAGTLGAVMLVGGLFGAVIIPPFSDKQHKRKKFLLLGIVLAIPGLIGLTFATSFELLLASAFALGFFLISTSPIGMQYAAEITQPTPEGTSNGLIQLFGQASVIFVYIMEALKSSDGSFTPSLLMAVGLLIVSALIITRLKDPQG